MMLAIAMRIYLPMAYNALMLTKLQQNCAHMAGVAAPKYRRCGKCLAKLSYVRMEPYLLALIE